MGLAPRTLQIRWRDAWGYPAAHATAVSALIELCIGAFASIRMYQLIFGGLQGAAVGPIEGVLPELVSWSGRSSSPRRSCVCAWWLRMGIRSDRSSAHRWGFFDRRAGRAPPRRVASAMHRPGRRAWRCAAARRRGVPARLVRRWVCCATATSCGASIGSSASGVTGATRSCRGVDRVGRPFTSARTASVSHDPPMVRDGAADGIGDSDHRRGDVPPRRTAAPVGHDHADHTDPVHGGRGRDRAARQSHGAVERTLGPLSTSILVALVLALDGVRRAWFWHS
jgi:hypothetical protein